MNKSILFCLVTSLSFLSVSAQVEKSSLYPEFSMGRKFFYYNTNSFQTGISIGLNNHSTAGLFYSRTRYNSMPSNLFDHSHSVIDRVGLAYTYYSFFKSSRKWGWSLNGSVSYNRNYLYEKQTGANLVTRKYNESEFTVTPGIFYKPSDRIMLTGNIGSVSIFNNPYKTVGTRSSFAGELNLGIRISLKRNRNKK